VNLRAVEATISGLKLAGLVIHNCPNFVYLTGVRMRTFERPAFFVTNGRENLLIAPALDRERLRGFERAGGRVVTYGDGESPTKVLEDVAGSLGLIGEAVGYDSSIPQREFRELSKIFGEGRLVDASDYLGALRYAKTGGELELIKRAAAILDGVYRKVESNLETGLTEAMLSSLIVSWGMELGADDVFFAAVQAGENSAIPHHERSSRKLRRGDVIVIDVSLTYGNYFADLTRVFALGPIDSGVREKYAALIEAVMESASAAKPGTAASSLDRLARQILARRGLERHFIHRLGHGLGVEVHEPPYLAPSSTHVLAEGNVFTVEPGAYFPGRYGLRLERNLAIVGGEPEFLDSYQIEIVEK